MGTFKSVPQIGHLGNFGLTETIVTVKFGGLVTIYIIDI